MGGDSRAVPVTASAPLARWLIVCRRLPLEHPRRGRPAAVFAGVTIAGGREFWTRGEWYRYARAIRALGQYRVRFRWVEP